MEKRTRKRGRKSEASQSSIELGTDKLYFKIGEVSEIVGVAAYVLRYWESEFGKVIRPQKSRSQQRVYRRKDVENLLKIKHLLYERKFTIAGARQELGRGDTTAIEPATPSQAYKLRQSAAKLRSQIDGLARLLELSEEELALAADPSRSSSRLTNRPKRSEESVPVERERENSAGTAGV